MRTCAAFVVFVAAPGALPGTPAAFADDADVWSSPTPMFDDAREDHTSTLLPDGRVLIAGGTFVAFVNQAKFSAYLYDPASNAWTRAAPMATARYNHTATLLGDGRVLVAGGYGPGPGGSRSSVELYSAATDTWTPAAPMHRARESHTATLMPGGKVLVSGGLGDDPTWGSTSEVYDPVTDTWSEPVAMHGNRKFNARAAPMADGRVLVTGGSDIVAVETAEAYDPATDDWTSVTWMGTAREKHIEMLLSTGKILVAGGVTSRLSGSPVATSAELYDPQTNSWSPAASMTSPRYSPAATMLASGKILVSGGNSGEGGVVKGGSPGITSAELYDPVANTWTPLASMHVRRYQHAASLLADGRVLVSGGVNVSTSEIWGQPSRPVDPSPGAGPGAGPTGPGPGTTGAALGTGPVVPKTTVPPPAQAPPPPCSGLAGTTLRRCKAKQTYTAALAKCNAIKTKTRAARTRRTRCVASAKRTYKRALALARCASLDNRKERSKCAARARRIR